MQVSDFLNKLKQLQYQDLVNIKGVGPILAKNYVEFVSSSRFSKMYANFRDLESRNKGLNITHNKVVNTGLPLSAEVICITGSFDKSRNELKEILENRGAKVVDSVTTNTTTLLAGDKAGSKLEKAKKLNIKIINDYNKLLDLD